MTNSVDLLIVGQGLAGINLSFMASNSGAKIFHIHHSLDGESTPVAAGLINPITGRRFVKSWRIDEVMPFALEHYHALEKYLDINFIHKINILRCFKNSADENTWLAKSADNYLRDYILDSLLWNKEAYAKTMKLPELIGELRDCIRLDLNLLQKKWLSELRKESTLLEETFIHEDLKEEDGCWRYKNIVAKNVVFCEGWRVGENPYFGLGGFSPAKGELLLIHAPSLKLDRAFKKDIFITPLGNDTYWIGATYEWQNFDTSTTDKMKSRLLESLDDMINVPYNIIAHLSGIRPSSKDRRPVVGRHPKHQNLFIFNGMGTKGSSLSPLFAQQLLGLIQKGIALDKEVDFSRYVG